MVNTGEMAIPLQLTKSQQDVVEKLHNFTAFSEQIILLAGPEGAGKSSILEVFLEQASDYANLAYLPVSDRAKTDVIRKRLLMQLVKLDAYASDDTLAEALVRNLPSGTQHIVIVVDDAENVPPDLLTEFQALIAHGQQSGPQQRFSIILAGDTDWAARAHKGFSLGNQESPTALQVEPLKDTEKAWFSRALLDTQSRQISDHKLRKVLQGLQGYPGELQLVMRRLVQPAEAEQPPPPEREPVVAEPTRRVSVPILLAVAAVISIVVSLWLHWDSTSSGLEEEAEAPVITENSETITTEPESPDEALAESDQRPVAETAVPETPLPDYSETLGRIQQSRQPRQPEQDISLQLVRPLEVLKAEAEMPVTEFSETEQSENPWLRSYDNEELWQAPADEYVLQIGAFSSEPRLQQWLNSLDYEDLAVYHTQRDGESWYVVTLGRFATASEARSFLASSDERIRSLQAWPKSLAAVQSELAAVLP